MLTFDSDIRDQAYQFFIQEAVEFLQILETGLMNLTQEHDTAKIHELMRAAHSIKGGAASVGLGGIQQLAYQLEDCLIALYQDSVTIDTALEDLLLQALDCLQKPLMAQIETGHYDEESAQLAAEPIYIQLVELLGEAMQGEAAMPSSAELGIDIVQAIFAGDVSEGLNRLEKIVTNPATTEIAGEIRAQTEVFLGVGELVNLPGWVSIAKAILAALQAAPQQAREIAQVALSDLRSAQAVILAGDRLVGGEASVALLAYGELAAAAASSPIDYPLAALDAAVEDDWADLIGDTLPFEAASADITSADITSADITDNNFIRDNITSDNIAIAANVINNQFDVGASPGVDDLAFAEMAFADLDWETLPTDQFDELFSLALDPEDDPLRGFALEPTVADDVQPTPPAVVIEAAMPLSGYDAITDRSITDLSMSDTVVELPWETATLSAVTDLSALMDWSELIQPTVTPPLSPVVEAGMQAAGMQAAGMQAAGVQAPDSIQNASANPVVDQAIAQLAHQLNVPPLDLPTAPEPAVVEVNDNIAAIQRGLAAANSVPNSNSTVRIDHVRLERINHLIGEMVTQENRTLLKNQQLQAVINATHDRFAQFEVIAKQIGSWTDRSQKTLANQHQNRRSRLNLNEAVINAVMGQSSNLPWVERRRNVPQFDPLQMDSYSELYQLAQEMLELIAQLGEGMSDMTSLSQQNQQGHRQQQLHLKQIRDDLRWAQMLPLGDLLQRFPRMLRDLSTRYGKQVTLKLSGEQTLVDKSVLQILYDPLVHLLRNAFDHGIELPEDRVAAGKSAQATIAIRSYHRGNQTYIEVSDDGRGIDPEKIRTKIIAQALLTADAAAQLTADQLYSYLFHAGFSTADKVSELSGRGVGLDAVLQPLQAQKGNVSITSQLGQGTVFTLRFPMSMTIAKLLVFSLQSRIMALPLDALSAIVTVPKTAIQLNQGRKCVEWQGQTVPLLPRSHFLQHYPHARQGLPEHLKVIPIGQPEQETILLVESEGQLVALVVEQILQEQEFAIKPFSNVLPKPDYFCGCTILGNGLLVPVLDTQALSRSPLRSRDRWEDLGPDEGAIDRSTATGIATHQAPLILVIDDSLTTRQTLALTLQKAGYRVLQAKDGREGLNQLQTVPDIQVVFSDVEMPVMNGFEFLSQCRLQYTKEQLPVIMLTSRGGDKHRQIAQYMGANAYLVKPYLEQAVLNILESVLVPLP
jgi:two-component system, chemotaxis family, sensor histidine kinase and response regulator PixL